MINLSKVSGSTSNYLSVISKQSYIGLSVNFQLSSRSYNDLAGKVVFGLSMVFRSHYTETANFTDLGDC